MSSGVTVAPVRFGSLSINVTSQNQQQITFQGYGNDGMQVLDNGNSVYTNTNKQSISIVNIQLVGKDSVVVDDSNGMPFAQGTRDHHHLFGIGSNTLTLQGSRAVAGDEIYIPGESTTPGYIFLDNLTFKVGSSIASVTDKIKITGTFDVQTSRGRGSSPPTPKRSYAAAQLHVPERWRGRLP